MKTRCDWWACCRRCPLVMGVFILIFFDPHRSRIYQHHPVSRWFGRRKYAIPSFPRNGATGKTLSSLRRTSELAGGVSRASQKRQQYAEASKPFKGGILPSTPLPANDRGENGQGILNRTHRAKSAPVHAHCNGPVSSDAKGSPGRASSTRFHQSRGRILSVYRFTFAAG